MDEEELKNALRNIPGGEYPRDLSAASKAEYVTMVRMLNKDKQKKGCPLAVLTLLFRLSVIVGMTSLLS